MAKELKAKPDNRVLADEEVVKIVAKFSPRYKILDSMLRMDDDTFYNKYLEFKEHELPMYLTNFRSEKYPQLTANLFYVVEMRECKKLNADVLRRFNMIKESRHPTWKDKSLRGRYLSKTNVSKYIEFEMNVPDKKN